MSTGILVKKRLNNTTDKYENIEEIDTVPSSLKDFQSVNTIINGRANLIEINCSRSRFDNCPPPTK